MKKLFVTSLATLVGSTMLGCGPEYAPYEGSDLPEPVGSASAAVAQCEGDDLQYDFNAFAASLAVGIANELGRWDVLTDFDLVNGKLRLSQTGRSLCEDTGCDNVEALLQLQEDASSEVPYHSPSLFREKLASWYATQERALVELSTAGQQSEGTYRFVSVYSNKRMTVDYGSMNAGAWIELKDWAPYTGGDEWQLQVSGRGHKLVNVRSGKCLDVQYGGGRGSRLIQSNCGSASSQVFELKEVANGSVGILDRLGNALEVQNWNGGNDVPVVTGEWNQYHSNKMWRMEAINGGGNQTSGIASGMYAMIAMHTKKGIQASTSSNYIEQRSYYGDNDYAEWYASKVGDKYQFINRHTGQCMSLVGGYNSDAVQQAPCANVSDQLFQLERVNDGEERYGIRGNYGKILGVKGYGRNDGDRLVATSGSVDQDNERFSFEDILAGERHELTFSHVTNDGPCGDYYWYEISQPNGLPLAAPEDTFVQLIFAGGKTAMNGRDDNPFIAQQVSGTMVAIDPTSYLTSSSRSASGSCTASDIKYDSSRSIGGDCCIKYNGSYGTFKQSTWSSTIFLCK